MQLITRTGAGVMIFNEWQLAGYEWLILERMCSTDVFDGLVEATDLMS